MRRVLWYLIHGFFAVAGMAYASTSVLAEYYYAQGWLRPITFDSAIQNFKKADAIFPLCREYRMAGAYIYLSPGYPGSSEPAIAALEHALRYNPFSADLIGGLVAHLLIQGRIQEAKDKFAILKNRFPNSETVRQGKAMGL